MPGLEPRSFGFVGVEDTYHRRVDTSDGGNTSWADIIYIYKYSTSHMSTTRAK